MTTQNKVENLTDTLLVTELAETGELAERLERGQARAGNFGMFLTTIRLHDLCNEVMKRVQRDGIGEHPVLRDAATRLGGLQGDASASSFALYRALDGVKPSPDLPIRPRKFGQRKFGL